MKLAERGLKQGDYFRNLWRAKPEDGTTVEDLLREDYWAFVSKNFKKGDKIECFPDSGEWFAELIVLSCGIGFAKMGIIHQVSFAKVGEQSDEYEISHRGRAGWSVKRKTDSQVMFDKGATREDAERWVEEHKVAA